MARVGGIDSVLWEEFRKVFQNKFYPRPFCDAKRNEFMSLVQGNMTVMEYEKKFTEMANYVLCFVIDETDKCMHFQDSPRIEIWALIMTSAALSYFSKLVKAAMCIKRCLAKGKSRSAKEGQSDQITSNMYAKR